MRRLFLICRSRRGPPTTILVRLQFPRPQHEATTNLDVRARATSGKGRETVPPVGTVEPEYSLASTIWRPGDPRHISSGSLNQLERRYENVGYCSRRFRLARDSLQSSTV